MIVRVQRQALAEAKEAAARYDEQNPGLGRRFIDDLDQTSNRIRQAPEMFPTLETPSRDLVLRHSSLHRFPYALLFVEIDRELRIVAIAHQSRLPDYWRERLRDLNL